MLLNRFLFGECRTRTTSAELEEEGGGLWLCLGLRGVRVIQHILL